MSEHRTIVIIPHYRHEQTIVRTAQEIVALGLPCLVIDDGSGKQATAALAELETIPNVEVIYRAENGGKGAAVIDGISYAHQQGYTHAIQIDADRQHKVDDIPKLLAASRTHPDATICGRPIYGEDAPKSRLYGRKITNFWIWVNTGSRELPDGMCGFRLYPIAPFIAVLNHCRIGQRMDFDVEILVRLHWQGMRFIWIDTPVQYAEDGVSHFDTLKDNIDISKMHARLFFIRLKNQLLAVFSSHASKHK